MNDISQPTTARADDEKLTSIRALLNLSYPEIAAKGSALSLLLATSRDLLARLDDRHGTAFPGHPGSRWCDVAGDEWVLGDDGRMNVVGCTLDANDVAESYGPLTRAGGE